MMDDYFWWLVAGSMAVVAAVSILADRHRTRRVVIENVGFMPWTGISVFSTLFTVLSIAMAIKSA